MMKKIIVLFIGLFVIGSCDNFLSETPKDQIGSDQYFDKPADGQSAVNGLYHIGVPSFYDAIGGIRGNGIMMGAWMSGLFDSELKGEATIITRVQNLTIEGDNTSNFLANLWQRAYQAISRANTAIKYIPEIDGLSKTESQRLLAQAKFFRAFNYFYLVKHFGGVPLITEPYEGPTNLEVPRDSIETVYNEIISDLNFVINKGDLGTGGPYMGNYRITRGIAETLLADVQLQRAGYPSQASGAYAQAAKAAKKVIKSGEYQLIKNGSTKEKSAYNIMRTSDQEREYIYSIEYSSDVNSPSNMSALFSIPTNIHPAGLNHIGNRNQDGYLPIKEYTRVYNPKKDLRIQDKQFFYNSIVSQGKRYEFGEIAPHLFLDRKVMFEGARGGRDMRIYRYAEVLLIAAEAIARSEGVTSEAVSYLADVRNRAYWKTSRSDIVSYLSGLSVQGFVKEVWKERLRELPFSYKVWSDIQRTRKYPATSENNPGEVSFEDVIGHSNNWGQTFQKYQLLFPIPSNEISRNPKLKQNPGYK